MPVQWRCIYILFVLWTTVSATCLHRRQFTAPRIPPRIRSQQCSVRLPETALAEQQQWLAENERNSTELWNATSVEAFVANSGTLTRRTAAISVDTYIHVVSSNKTSDHFSKDHVTDIQIINQFGVLSRSYNNTAIHFNLVNITRTINDTWAKNGDDEAMKKKLRQGGYSSLNIFLQEELSSDGGLLGFCSLPMEIESNDTSSYLTDGCNVLAGTRPGGPTEGYNLGYTVVHEVGHWFGLLHTFEGNTCANNSWGDYVDDTPQQKQATAGCPTDTQDTCPNSGVTIASGKKPGPQGYAGPDPIHNFMDYSNNECMNEFTPGQTARMLNFFDMYRKGK